MANGTPALLEFREVFQAYNGHAVVRVGTGAAFSAGADMNEAVSAIDGSGRSDGMAATIARIARFPKPLVACVNAGGLHEKDGAWHGPPDGKPVSGMTTADLARDGMLTVTTNHRFGSAQLTERGNWFARTLLCQGTTANSESVRFGSCSPAPTR